MLSHYIVGFGGKAKPGVVPTPSSSHQEEYSDGKSGAPQA
jgi:hypothetical protein